MEKNQKDFKSVMEQKMEDETLINEFQTEANKYYKRSVVLTGCANFMAFVGILLTVGFVVVNLPLMNGAPIYVIEGQLAWLLLLCAAGVNLISVILSTVAKKNLGKAYANLLKKGEVSARPAPLYVRVV